MSASPITIFGMLASSSRPVDGGCAGRLPPRRPAGRRRGWGRGGGGGGGGGGGVGGGGRGRPGRTRAAGRRDRRNISVSAAPPRDSSARGGEPNVLASKQAVITVCRPRGVLAEARARARAA